MLNRLVSILVAAALLACPFLCGAGSVVAADSETQSARCSCCHRTEVPKDTAPNDNDGRHNPTGCCQCVCGGAVFEHVPQRHVDLDFGVWATPAAVELRPAVALAQQMLASQARLQPDDGMNPGRSKCCLFMTFLC